MKLTAIAFLLVLSASLMVWLGSGQRDRLSAFPKTVVWVWERPEHLEQLDRSRVGFAYLAQTFRLRGDRILSLPRLQPARFPQNAALMAVVRIESDGSEPAALSGDAAENLAERIISVVKRQNVRALQIDFDARRNEREFYKTVLHLVRDKLPADMPLSMTALASWCDFDLWLARLPVDEVVPMLFRMGQGGNRVLSDIDGGRHLTGADSGVLSLGVSVDEPASLAVAQRALASNRFKRVYVFSPSTWSSNKNLQVMREVNQWL